MDGGREYGPFAGGDGKGQAAQDAHRYIDTYLLASNGVTEKERLMSILAEQGMGAFLSERDAPYGER